MAPASKQNDEPQQLTLVPGQRYIITGPANCGKTYLAQCLARADPSFIIFDETSIHDVTGSWIFVIQNTGPKQRSQKHQIYLQQLH